MHLCLDELRKAGQGKHIGRMDESANIGEALIADFDGYEKMKEYPKLLEDGTIRHGEGFRALTDEDRAYMKQVLAGDTYGAKPPGGESGRALPSWRRTQPASRSRRE